MMGRRRAHSLMPCQRICAATRSGARGTASAADGDVPQGRFAADAVHGGDEGLVALPFQDDRYGEPFAGFGELHAVLAVDVVERRDVEGFRDARPACAVGFQEVAVPLPVRVVDLDDDAAQLAGGVMAPEHAQRVEDVPEDPGAGEHGDASAVEPVSLRGPDPLGGKVAFHVAAQGAVRVAEVVLHPEAGQRPEQARQLREVVDVDIPAVAAVGEGVAQRGAPHVRDDGAVDGCAVRCAVRWMESCALMAPPLRPAGGPGPRRRTACRRRRC